MLNLTQSNNYEVVNYTGLEPPTATINYSSLGANNGAIFNISRVDTRNITITILLKRDIENSRINLLKYFKTRRSCRLYYKN